MNAEVFTRRVGSSYAPNSTGKPGFASAMKTVELLLAKNTLYEYIIIDVLISSVDS